MAMRVYSLIWGTTGGGPSEHSMVAQVYIVKQGLGGYLEMGYSAALGIIFAVITGMIALLLMRFQHRTERRLGT
jgi:ABC-type sugar transport system permease subunit